MHRYTLLLALLATGSSMACVSSVATGPAVSASTSTVPPVAESSDSTAPALPAFRHPVVLGRDLHDAEMTEVVLCPRGRAALTLDAEGGVRLWEDVRAGGPSVPLTVAAHEPAWMSLASAGTTGFVVGFVDTTGGVQISRIERSESGASQVPLFEISPRDPAFELHVLDGGERVLVLGIDHRIRLYDTEGNTLSVLDEHGFTPWQLRVTQPAGAAPAIAAVLAGPTRTQALSVEDDRVRLLGEAHTIELDEGPNRNSMALTPDGRTVVAMRRHERRGRSFSLVLTDLQTGARRRLVTHIDARERPRMHVVDEHRVLLESETGKGFWVDLAAATPVPEGTNPAELEVEPTPSSAVDLPASTPDRRMHTTVVRGVRAVPMAHALVIDAIDEDGSAGFHAAPLQPDAVALDPSGERVAWLVDGRVFLDAVDGRQSPRELTWAGGDPVRLSFVARDRLLVVTRGGEALELRLGDDEHVERVAPPEPDLEPKASEIRRRLIALGVDDPVARDARVLVVDDRGRHYFASTKGRPIVGGVGEGVSFSLRLREGRVTRLVPSPCGTLVAVVQRDASAPGSFTLSIVDVAAGVRLWTRRTNAFDAPSWSRTGERIAVGGLEGGRVFQARSGELVLHRTAHPIDRPGARAEYANASVSPR